MESSRFDTLNEAVSYAEAHRYRQRAVCYVTRGVDEVLALKHVPQPGVTDKFLPGIQVPAGGVEVSETPAQTAIREVFEETGLDELGSPIHLGSSLLSGHNWTGLNEVWHYFQLLAPLNIDDAWRHAATGMEDNNEMLFEVWFTSLAEPDITNDYGSHEYLPELIQLLQESR